MKLTLLPLDNDKVLRLACCGEMGRFLNPDEEPLRILLGPSCYSLRVVLDMEHVPSIDTSGLGWLLGVSKKFSLAGGKLVLHSVPPLVQQVIAFVQMTDLVLMAADEQSARELAAADGHTGVPPFGNHSRPRDDFKNRKIS